MRLKVLPALRLLVLAAGCIATVFALGPVSAHAQQPDDPLAGLPPGVHGIALAIDGGDPGEIVAHLHPETVITTAYPGHGEERPRSVAEDLIPQFVVSGGSAPDAMGTADYRLIGVWLPANSNPPVSLIASGIGADNERLTTIFGLEETGGEWRIRSIGTVGGYQGMPEGVESTMAFLDWLATQGEYREVTAPLPPAPAPPATGNGLATGRDGAQAWQLPAMLAVAAALLASAGIYARSRHKAFPTS